MKKFLLIAAMAAVALGASAGYNLEKVWEINDISFLTTADCRQGFGMNGKFYINDKVNQTVYVVDENGLTGETFPGGNNCGITRDEAGNIIVSKTGFAGSTWNNGTILVIDPQTGETKEYTIPSDFVLSGRCDFMGFAKGDLMEDGVLYLTGKKDAEVYTDGAAVFTITGGEVDEGNCYLASIAGDSEAGGSIMDTKPELRRDNMTVLNYYVDLNGEPSVLFVYRSQGSVQKMAYDGDNFIATDFTLPNKGACSGTCPFIWNGKELFVYPMLPNYQNAWGIAEANAEEPLFAIESSVGANMNAFQGNWVNAEVDEDGVTIYHYAPGANLTVWRLTYDLVYTVVGPDNVFGSNWDPADENNNMVMGEDDIYTWSAEGVTLYGDLEFKVVGDHDYSIYEWPMGQNNWVAHLTEGEGIYDVLITFDPTADDADRITCTLTKTGEIGPVEHTYTVAGTENLFGTNWNPADVNNDMVKGADGIYTWTKDNVVFTEDTHIEFKVVQDHSWTYNWPTHNWEADLEAGTYDIVITFDPAAEDQYKITFTATRTDQPQFLRGDVNLDEDVTIADVTALIDILLGSGTTSIAADCDLNGEVGIADVTCLIDYLLSGNWPDE